MEIHVDLLNAETNEWIAGDAVKVRAPSLWPIDRCAASTTLTNQPTNTIHTIR